ncbi:MULTISPECIES: MptD family putative ECF transporter S component [Microbacterium]|uniref:Substrate-specific component BL0695 of predicted ECF transporter n=1 Tax=Microbacterium esteraromaticum TaxID=57043 RepID=A0A1R4KSZ0_9MICO|nr:MULTISPECIES: MptD family putative ECF transporter S component [Microbacterium]RCS62083.1 Trep_Strep domain-containing protein [Microbacterium sp. JB110]SJN47267.1 Substrate-specific component BL0695 of predicted ECF transporter [Microbacterium esteraromaticum]
MTDTALPPGSARPRLSLRFSARDLVNVAMFAVLMIVVTYAIGMLGIVSPLVWLAVVPVSVLVNGIVFMLFVTRVRHAGMVTLLGVVVALFYLLTGNTVFSSIGIIVLAVLAEVVLWGGGYRSRWAAIWAYTIFALSFFTPFLPLVFDREGYLTSPSFTRMGDEYVAGADALTTLPVLGVLAVAVAVAGFLGGLLGSAVLRKHFVRAGLA